MLTSEVLLIQVRSDDQIVGIKINDFEVKLSAYADDTYFFVLDIQSLLAVVIHVKHFRNSRH